MRHILTITIYDLLRSARQRETFLFGLLMPGVMMLLLGIAMGGMDDDSAILIDVVDEDGSPLSGQFVEVLIAELEDDTGAFRVCAYHAPAPDACDLDSDLPQNRADWRRTADDRLENTESYGVIFIEAGFGDTLRAGEVAGIVYKNSEALTAPTLAQQKIDAAVSRMGGSVAVANLTLDVAGDVYGPFEVADRVEAFNTVRAQVENAWADRPVQVFTEGTQEEVTRMGFNQSGPGIATMFVLIFMLNAATLLVSEREMGTLQRLYTLPVRKAVILAGKILGQYVYGLAIFAVLILVGALLGVEWGDNVIGIVLVVLTFTLTSTALGLALATVVRTSDQASNLSTLMAMVLAPLGGAWWPMEIVPDFMKTIGHVSPIAWGMDAFQEMMFYGGGVIDILPMLGVLLAMAVAFFAFGVFNFKYE